MTATVAAMKAVPTSEGWDTFRATRPWMVSPTK
jgi:hypothetical protein